MGGLPETDGDFVLFVDLGSADAGFADSLGLGVASLLTLFMIPTLYRVFQRGHGGNEFLEKHGEEQTY